MARFPTAVAAGMRLHQCAECSLTWIARAGTWSEWNEEFETIDANEVAKIRSAGGVMDCTAYECDTDDEGKEREPIEVGDGKIILLGPYSGPTVDIADDLDDDEKARLFEAMIAMDGEPAFLAHGQIVVVFVGAGMAIGWQVFGDYHVESLRRYILMRRDDLHVGFGAGLTEG